MLAAGSTVHFLIAIALVFGVTFAVGVVDDEAPGAHRPAVPACLQTLPQTGQERRPAARPARSRRPRRLPGCAPTTGSSRSAAPARRPGRPSSSRSAPRRAGRSTWSSSATARSARSPSPRCRCSARRWRTRRRSRPSARSAPGHTLVTERLGPVDAAQESVDRLGLIIKGTWVSLTEKLGTITKLYSDERDPQGLVGAYGAGRVSGEILAAGALPLDIRISDFLLLMAGLNLFVGVFNLLPLLPLDGGHLAVLGFEQARDRLRRLRGYRGDLQRVDLTKLLPLTYAVVVVFIGATLFILGADIVNPISLTGS